MHRNIVLLALALAVLAIPSLAHAHVEISGETHIYVPYNDCVSETWYASPTHYDSYSWSWDGNTAGSGTSFGKTFCSPNLTFVTQDNHTLKVTATNNGVPETDTFFVTVTYLSACGTQISC